MGASLCATAETVHQRAPEGVLFCYLIKVVNPPHMDRKALYEKLHSMILLKESTDFEGEAANAAAMIEKLCKQHGISVEDALTPQVHDEEFLVQKKLNAADFGLFAAVARFYDAFPYVKSDRTSGRVIQHYQCIGTEAQQIQTRLYYEYLHECMEKECEKAMKAEKILAELKGIKYKAYGFSSNFNKAFVNRVEARLEQLKEKDHPHKPYVEKVSSLMKLGKIRYNGPRGAGSLAGYNVGSTVGLLRQAEGTRTTPMLQGAF